MKKLSNRGDTIIEVLLALSVISSVLGAAYAATARSLRLGRQAQERTEALKLVEGQVEKLKASVRNLPSGTQYATTTERFCINDSLVKRPIEGIGSYVEPPLDQENFLLFADSSNPDNDCQDGFYSYFIVRDTSLVDTYKVYARWDRLGGNRDETKIVYRVYAGN